MPFRCFAQTPMLCHSPHILLLPFELWSLADIVINIIIENQRSGHVLTVRQDVLSGVSSREKERERASQRASQSERSVPDFSIVLLRGILLQSNDLSEYFMEEGNRQKKSCPSTWTSSTTAGL